MSMQRRMPATVGDYWEILVRRKWLLIIPAVTIAAIIFIIGLTLPKTYRSETLILVDPQKVPSDYVKPTVSSDVTDRLQTISQEILSRTRLEKIIDQFGLYKDQRQALTDEDIVDLMRKQITVEIVTDPRADSRKPAAGFRISYTGRDPKLVQQVTRQIASLFIEENLKSREQQAQGTNDFIEAELEKARVNLQEQEDKIRGFKAQYMGSLPEQEAANLQMVGQLQTLLQANNDALARADQQRVYLQSLIDASKQNKPVTPTNELETELQRKRAELDAAEQAYTPSHPDVVRLHASVDALEKEVATAKREAAENKSPDEALSQLSATNEEIKRRSRTQRDLEQRIHTIQARVAALPSVESKFADLNRDYEISKAHYQSLLEKKNSSAMAAEMEARAKGEQFRILDPASLPEKPFKPDLAQFNLLGCSAGLFLGLLLVGIFEYRDPTIHHKRDAEFYLSMPVFAVMPVLHGGSSITPNRAASVMKPKSTTAKV